MPNQHTFEAAGNVTVVIAVITEEHADHGDTDVSYPRIYVNEAVVHEHRRPVRAIVAHRDEPVVRP
ncbi:hypothetical protein AGRA3207_007520 [Actinomadura graeca]|uniref:Uncharacterized protein n=1 Tax=Actinomadura graeca TaxID=2750812 RepID=A0ABX8R4F0_9ACTN|nr:hypothetical protein [Actinomadura graeca]QXJ25951.1 hypothetical protein AGRA3207_007520 [Actinomadura graeca]